MGSRPVSRGVFAIITAAVLGGIATVFLMFIALGTFAGAHYIASSVSMAALALLVFAAGMAGVLQREDAPLGALRWLTLGVGMAGCVASMLIAPTVLDGVSVAIIVLGVALVGFLLVNGIRSVMLAPAR